MKFYVGIKIKNVETGSICTILREGTAGWVLGWTDNQGKYAEQVFTSEKLIRDIEEGWITIVTNGLNMIKRRHNL